MNNYIDANYIYEYEVMLLLMFSQGYCMKKKIDSISFYQIIII